jgi:hypothetical protein
MEGASAAAVDRHMPLRILEYRPARETDAALLAFRDWLHGEAKRQRQLEADLLDLWLGAKCA